MYAHRKHHKEHISSSPRFLGSCTLQAERTTALLATCYWCSCWAQEKYSHLDQGEAGDTKQSWTQTSSTEY